MDIQAKDFVAGSGVGLAGEIPFHPALRSAEESGRTWLSVDDEVCLRVAAALGVVRNLVGELARLGMKTNEREEEQS